MGMRDFNAYARLARPILNERDYETVKRLAMERAKDFLFLDAGRIEAMIRELTDYEQRTNESASDWAIGWVEWALVPHVESDDEPHRRWSDVHPVPSQSNPESISTKHRF